MAEAADSECPLLRRYRRGSRRDADIAKLAFLTHLGHVLLQAFAAQKASFVLR
jgi:hypothetical protein